MGICSGWICKKLRKRHKRHAGGCRRWLLLRCGPPQPPEANDALLPSVQIDSQRGQFCGSLPPWRKNLNF